MADKAGLPAGAASASSLPPLAPGWTQNTAPTGHIYYYNAQTRESTYRRPAPSLPPPPPPQDPVPHRPHHTQPTQQPAPFLRLSDPRVANAFMAQQAASSAAQNSSPRDNRGERPRSFQRPHYQIVDKPRSQISIPGCEPWVLVYTKYGRRFVYNPVKNSSFWRIPDKLLPAILELDKAGIRPKAQAPNEKSDEAKASDEGGHVSQSLGDALPVAPSADRGGDSGSEYEEVEVSEDEEYEDEDNDGNRPKRQKTEDDLDAEFGGGPVEFSEADIAFQLQAAAGEMGGGYEQDDWEREEEGDFGQSEEEAPVLFKALLNDFNINPFSSWENLIEEGKIFDDERYTALPTMKARKAVWEEWARDAIRDRKAKKASEGKKDPRATYLLLLQDHATPKLYWPEFKRKYRKEAAMKDASLPERDKEKLYRDYVARLKLPSSTLKTDLTKLLDSIPQSKLNNRTSMFDLPVELANDLRYLCLDAKLRDTLVEAYLKTAGPPPP